MRPRCEKWVSMTAPVRKSMPGPISMPPNLGVSSDLPHMNMELDIIAAPALVPPRTMPFSNLS